VGGMMHRLDWAFYPGIAVLAAAVLQPFVLPQQSRLWWPLVIAGLVLVAISLIPWAMGARSTLGARSVRYGFNTLVMVVLALGIVGVVEALSYRHNSRLDLTENRRHSLSPQTIQMLKGLTTKVNAVSFYRSDQPGKRLAEDMFKQYARYAGDKFTWKSVDPDREPTLAKAFGVEAYGTTVLEAKGRTEKVMDAEQEEKLTNGLVRVTRESKRVVYIVQGHGEPEITNTERNGFSQAKEALDKANYDTKPLPLARQGKVPDDAAVLILAGPRTDLFPPEIDALDAYLGRGGKLLAMINPPFPERGQAESVKKLLGKYGFVLREDLVIELNPIGQLFGIGPQVPIVQQYEPHAITRDLAGITTLFPLTRSLNTGSPGPTGITVQALAKTSPDSWGETDRAELERGQVKPDPQDTKGPLTLAAVATKDKMRIVVYGTAGLAGNQFLNVQGNKDFFLNTVSWLAEQEDQISVRPKDTKQAPVFLTSQQAQAVFWLPVVILPAIGMVGGIIAVARRRAAK
jgi:ABC-type uncharacterized transport system involved in gliding motility auxiliary subunit